MYSEINYRVFQPTLHSKTEWNVLNIRTSLQILMQLQMIYLSKCSFIRSPWLNLDPLWKANATLRLSTIYDYNHLQIESMLHDFSIKTMTNFYELASLIISGQGQLYITAVSKGMKDSMQLWIKLEIHIIFITEHRFAICFEFLITITHVMPCSLRSFC